MYLVELKLLDDKYGKIGSPVLIVPSGIETKEGSLAESATDVLIVPSGIETSCEEYCMRCFFVLIVPSGIET